VTIALSRPDLGVEALAREAVLAAPGEWHVGGLVVPVGGTWRVEIGVLITDFERVILEGGIDVAPR
jgi:copper transport protein